MIVIIKRIMVIKGIDWLISFHMYLELNPKNKETGRVIAKDVMRVGLKPIGP